MVNEFSNLVSYRYFLLDLKISKQTSLKKNFTQLKTIAKIEEGKSFLFIQFIKTFFSN